MKQQTTSAPCEGSRNHIADRVNRKALSLSKFSQDIGKRLYIFVDIIVGCDGGVPGYRYRYVPVIVLYPIYQHVLERNLELVRDR